MPTESAPAFSSLTDASPELLHEIGQIYAAMDEVNPESAMMAAVSRLLPCFAAVLNAIHLRPNRISSWSSIQRPTQGPVSHPAIINHLHAHPALDRLISKPHHSALRLSDMADQPTLDANPFVAGYYRPLGLREQIVFPLGPATLMDEGAVWIVGVNRLEDRPFTDAEVQLCNTLQPHLLNVVRHVQNRRRREAALAARDGAAESAHCGLGAIQSDGTMVEVTPTARRLLQEWYGDSVDSTHLPAAFIRRLAQNRAHSATHRTPSTSLTQEDLSWTEERSTDGAVLSVHWRWSSAGNALAGLWLRETAPADTLMISRSLGLTTRQAAVARWIAEGKTNPEIGLLLGISGRTVDKHVEGILARLHVDSRSGVAHAVRSLSV